MTYTAYVMYKQDRELTTITRSDYTSKKAFAEDLRRNGYAVKLISTPEKFNHDLEVYCEKKERRNEIDRFVRAELKKSRERIKAATEELTKANNEEATQEDETMKFKKDYFAVTTKKIDEYNCIRFDADIEFYVTNCTETQEPAAIRKAVEKFIEELKKNEKTDILVDSLEMMLNCNEYDEKCTFNEIRNGGNAYEIEINRGGEKDLFIYLRICEHGDDITQDDIDAAFEEYVVNEFEEEKKEAEKLPKLYRNQPDNAPEVLEMLKNCKSMMYDWRKNQVIFFKDEGHILGRAVNADNMDIAVVAHSLGKIYDRTI